MTQTVLSALLALAAFAPLASAQTLDPGDAGITLLVNGQVIARDTSYTAAVTSVPTELAAGTHTFALMRGGTVLASKTFTTYGGQAYVLSAPSVGNDYDLYLTRVNAEE